MNILTEEFAGYLRLFHGHPSYQKVYRQIQRAKPGKCPFTVDVVIEMYHLSSGEIKPHTLLPHEFRPGPDLENLLKHIEDGVDIASALKIYLLAIAPTHASKL